MLRSIFMKEWLKTRMAVVLVFVASLGLCAYLLIDAHHLIAINGVMPVWDTLLGRDTLLLELLEFVPLIAGILLGCTQMLPEMLQKRIKLTLHLPIENWKAIGIMVLYGVIIMLGLLVLNIGLCYAVLQIWLPGTYWKARSRQIVTKTLRTSKIRRRPASPHRRRSPRLRQNPQSPDLRSSATPPWRAASFWIMLSCTT